MTRTLRINLQSTDHEILDRSALTILKTVGNDGESRIRLAETAEVQGVRVQGRVILVKNPGSKLVGKLQALDIPHNVSIEVSEERTN